MSFNFEAKVRPATAQRGLRAEDAACYTRIIVARSTVRWGFQRGLYQMLTGSSGRAAAAGVGATLLLAGVVGAAEATTFKAWPVSFNGSNGSYPVSPLYLASGKDAGILYGTAELGGGTGQAGTVFSVTQTGKLTPLYGFQGAPDGSNPEGGVAVENNGTIYGTTRNGGPESLNYPGVIYEMSSKGSETILYNFCQKANCADGMNPNSTLVADDRRGGFLYGTTYGGGNNNSGTLFQITTEGQMNASFYVFCQKANCADGAQPVGAPYIDTSSSQDFVYGVTSIGGKNGYGVVYATNGVNYNVLFDFDSTKGAYPSGGVILDKKSNVIGVADGGATNNGVVYKVPNSGGSAKVLYTFNGGSDGSGPVGELVQDPKGNLYGVTQNGGPQNSGIVYKLDPKGNETILHTFTGGADGGGPAAGLYGVYAKSGLKLFGTTTAGGTSGNGTIYEIEP